MFLAAVWTATSTQAGEAICLYQRGRCLYTREPTVFARATKPRTQPQHSALDAVTIAWHHDAHSSQRW